MARGCSVKELLATTDSYELSEWQAYFQLEPFGPWADNLNTGMIISFVRNMFAGKDSKLMDPIDVALGDFGKVPTEKKEEKQTVEQMKYMAKMIAAAFPPGSPKVSKHKKR